MTKIYIVWTAALCVSGCAAEPERVTADEQAYVSNQGTELQGLALQGAALQGMTLQGFQRGGATLNGAPLDNLRVDRGELVAEQDQVTLRGAALAGAHLFAQARALAASPPTAALVEYQITGIEDEAASYDPTQSGATYLYTLAQLVDGSAWQPACPLDLDGRRAAIPLDAIWDEHGDRIESSSLFTLGCTAGVIAKCYRWGYRPWLTDHGDLVATHWACTRLARADYCGNGVSHTRNGTAINLWDNASPAPIQPQGQTPVGMMFEAGWSTRGAVCLGHGRWLLGGPVIALGCPDRLIPPGLGIFNATVCDTTAQVLGQAGDARIFNESSINLDLDLDLL